MCIRDRVHIQHKNVLGAVLGKVRHQAELIGVVVCLHDAVGAAHQKQGVALGHPLPGHIVVKSIAGVVQHPEDVYKRQGSDPAVPR